MLQGGKIRLRFEVKPTDLVTDLADSGPGIAPEVAHLQRKPAGCCGEAKKWLGATVVLPQCSAV